jgi:hypothetical protein
VDDDARQAVVEELAGAFGDARDVSPAPDQPLHVLLPALVIPKPWCPSLTRGLVRFAGWPEARPDFWIDLQVVNADGEPPRSNSEELVLGETWRRFSFGFPWPTEPTTAVRAVQLWLTRFREPT